MTARTAFGILLFVCWGATAAAAADVTATWDGGSGTWSTGANWSGDVVPVNAGDTTYTVQIDGGKTVPSAVALDLTAGISALTLDAGDTLAHRDATTLAIYGGPVTNHGTWALASGGSNTDIAFVGNGTLDGTGAVALTNDVHNRVYCIGCTVTNGATHTIRGAGQVLVGVGGMNNAGTVTADQPTLLQLAPSGLGVINTGSLQARAGGTLELGGGPFTNGSGIIEALDGSTVRLLSPYGGAPITGGTLRSVGTGVVLTGGGARLTEVTTAGTLQQPDGQATVVAGTLTNDAIWTLLSAGNNTDVVLVDGATLRGTGAIVLGNDIHNRVYCSGGTVTNAATHTIRGAGQVLVGVGGMLNAGAVIADQPTVLQVAPSSLGVTNTGSLQARAGGTLELGGGPFTNNSGIVEALDGSTVRLLSGYGGAPITGGTLRSVGSGVVLTGGGARLTDVTTGGTLQQPDGQATVVTGTLTNDATWTLLSAGNNTDVVLLDGARLSGTGAIVLGNDIHNRVYCSGGTVTNAATHTIRGAGQVLVGVGGMINAGAVIADRSTLLQVAPSGLGVTNTGSLQARDGGTLELGGGPFTNTGGIIEALAGSTVRLLGGYGGAPITGGTVRSAGSGVVLTGGGARLTDVTTGGTVQQSDGQWTVVTGTLTNDATWTLLSAGNNTDLVLADGATLSGAGGIVLGNEIHNRVYCNGGAVTNAATHTIRGAGQVLSSVCGMTNAGTILADRPVALAIDPNGLGFENTGTLRATGTGGLTSSGGPFKNSGTVVVGSGSRLARGGDYVQRAGTTAVEGGTLSVTGLIDLQAGTLAGVGTVSGGVRNAADVRPGTPVGTLTVTGAYTQTAGGTLTIHLGGGAPDTSRLAVSGAAALDGALRIVVASGFPASVGQTFDVVTYGQRSGTFASVDGLTQPNGLVLTASYGPSAVTLTVVHAAFTPTPTATATATPTRTATATLNATATMSPTPVPSSTHGPTPSVTPTGIPTTSPTAGTPTATASATATSSPTATTSSTPTATPTPPVDVCVGDCNSLREVTVAEILTMVNIALGMAPVTTCPAGDANGDGEVTIEEILAAVNNALVGCPGTTESARAPEADGTRRVLASRPVS